MKSFYMMVPVLLALAGACRHTPAPAATPQGSMSDMPGMGGAPAADSSVAVDRAEAARLGVTFARATLHPVRPAIRAVGVLRYPDPSLVDVNARVGGWVEHLYVDYVGAPVTAGEPLLALYSPDLVAAQQEILVAQRLHDDTLAAAARRRLVLWDVPPDQIDSVLARDSVSRTLILRAPRSGEVIQKMVVQGQAVKAGDNLFRLANRSILWLDLAVFEQDLRSIAIGRPVIVHVDALPGRVFPGRVSFLEPALDEATRTMTARVEVKNPDGQLRPGMYATGELSASARPVLSVPLEAVLPTGTRNLVFVNRGDGRFVPREVAVGQRGDSLIEIVSGLKPGDEVVATATFLFDSESNLAAALKGLMLQMGMGLDMGGMRVPKGGKGDSMPGMQMNPGVHP